MVIITDIELTEYFSLCEFECPCCRRVMLSPDLFTRLNHLRMVINKPVYITSGYRCKEENHKVGGVSGSYHLRGMAVDIQVKDYILSDLLLYAQELIYTGLFITILKWFNLVKRSGDNITLLQQGHSNSYNEKYSVNSISLIIPIIYILKSCHSLLHQA